MVTVVSNFTLESFYADTVASGGGELKWLAANTALSSWKKPYGRFEKSWGFIIYSVCTSIVERQ